MSGNRTNEEQPGLWDVPDQRSGGGRKRKSREATTAPRQAKPPGGRQRATPLLPMKRPTGPMEFKEIWDIDDLANYLGVPKQTIYSWRQTNYGPKAFRVGKHLRWRAATVIEWTLGLEREP